MKLFFKIRLCLMVATSVWLLFCSGRVASQDEINRLRDKTDQIEQKQQTLALAIEGRLTRVETNLDTLAWLLRGVSGAVGLLVIETCFAAVVTNRRLQTKQEKSS